MRPKRSSDSDGGILTDHGADPLRFRGERRWIVRSGPIYELTPLGEFVADRYTDLRSAMDIAHELYDVVPWLPGEIDDFSIDLFADATVSFPGAGYPCDPVERVIQLIQGTENLRGFGAAVMKSNALEAVCRTNIDGMEFEYIGLV